MLVFSRVKNVIYLIGSDFTKPLQLHATIMEYETKTQMTETHVQVVWIDIDKENNETLDARKFRVEIQSSNQWSLLSIDKSSLGPNVYSRNSWAAETSWDNAFTGLSYRACISILLGGKLRWQKKCSCPGVLCLRDGGPSSLEGTAYWGVVHFYCYDCLLGFPYIVGKLNLLHQATYN